MTKSISRPIRAASILLLPLLLGAGQATAHDEHDERRRGREHSAPRCEPARDRAAILGMAGTFDVSFNFEEVKAIAPGYELRDPYTTGGTEVVSAIDQGPGHVVLQHVLLIEIGPDQFFPLKHWRQDWVFQDRELLEFQGNRIWTHRRLSKKEARCTWSQAVSQVDDGPRYESYGFWKHRRHESSWTSRLTYRPLPRREFSQRSDYDVLLAVNTHVVRAAGWDHEEDNWKLQLDTRSALVKEEGLNQYTRINLPAERVALDYLERTADFWADVRVEWEALIGEHGSVQVENAIDGVAPYDILFAVAEEMANVDPEVRRALIHDTLDPYVSPVDLANAGGGAPRY